MDAPREPARTTTFAIVKPTDLRNQLERIRGELDRALHGDLGLVEAFERKAEEATARARELEAERAALVAKVAAFEEERARYQARLAELGERMRGFGDAEAAFRSELAKRDDQIRALSAAQDRWEQKLQALMELKDRLEALLGEEAGFEVA